MNLGRVRVRLGVHVRPHRYPWTVNGHLGQSCGEGQVGRFHERRMESARDSQADRACSHLLCQTLRGFARGLRTGDHDVGWAEQVSQLEGSFSSRGGAELFNLRLVQPQHAKHAARRSIGGGLHRFPAPLHNPKAVVKAQGPRKDQSRVFSKAQAGRGLALLERVGVAGTQRFQSCQAGYKDSRLAYDCGVEFFGRTAGAELGKIVTKNLRSFVEQSARRRQHFAQGTAHADSLCALAGKKKSDLRHKSSLKKQTRFHAETGEFLRPYGRAALLVVARHLGARFQLPDDELVELGTGILSRNRQCVLDSALSRAAVANDADAVYSEQRRPALGTVVVVVHEGLQRLLTFLTLGFERAQDFLGHHFNSKLKDPLAYLQHDIADEAIGDNHVAGAAIDVAAFDVADELLPQGAAIEKRVRFLGQVMALLFLRADVHEADGRLVALEDMAGEYYALDAVIEKVRGHLVDVGVDILKHTSA